MSKTKQPAFFEDDDEPAPAKPSKKTKPATSPNDKMIGTIWFVPVLVEAAKTDVLAKGDPAASSLGNYAGYPGVILDVATMKPLRGPGGMTCGHFVRESQLRFQRVVEDGKAKIVVKKGES